MILQKFILQQGSWRKACDKLMRDHRALAVNVVTGTEAGSKGDCDMPFVSFCSFSLVFDSYPVGNCINGLVWTSFAECQGPAQVEFALNLLLLVFFLPDLALLIAGCILHWLPHHRRTTRQRVSEEPPELGNWYWQHTATQCWKWELKTQISKSGVWLKWRGVFSESSATRPDLYIF